MYIFYFLQENQDIIVSALSGIIGASVGGFATYKTMTKQFKIIAEQEQQKQKREDELYLKRKREETYIELLAFLEECKNSALVNEGAEILSILYAKAQIYSTNEILSLFTECSEKHLKGEKSSSVGLIDMIRKELGIRG